MYIYIWSILILIMFDSIKPTLRFYLIRSVQDFI